MNIASLLNYVDQNQLGLAPIARRSAWKADQVVKLFNALYRDYPVGGLIFWVPPTKAVPFQTEGAKQANAAEIIVDGSQRIAAIYGALRGRQPQFLSDGFLVNWRLFFHVEQQQFAFHNSLLADDPRWIDLADFFQAGTSCVGKTIMAIHSATFSGEGAIGETARRVQQLANIGNRNLYVQYMPVDASLEDCQEIYLLANGGAPSE